MSKGATSYSLILKSSGLASIALSMIGTHAPSADVGFRKVVLDARFVAEGVAVGDVNRDGRLDVLAGNAWYEAPGWKAHEIAPVKEVDPKTAWSNCFNSWAADLNGDGWIDQIVIGAPGTKAVWRENPKGASGAWKEHLIWRSAGNESPLYEDLFRDGKKVLIMGYDDAYLAWFEPAKDPYAEWVCHNVSDLKGAGSQRYSHGLGVGDLDGDGVNEILTTAGYYSAPKEGRRRASWTFVKADLGPDCAQMLAVQREKGKRAEILTTSAHARGVWRFTPREGGGYQRRTIDETISVTHSAQLARLGRANTLNLITGKRQWAHPPGVDVGSDEPPWLVRYEWIGGEWVRHTIDEASGVGTQFVVRDLGQDGLLDIVTANKNGVFLFVQLPQ